MSPQEAKPRQTSTDYTRPYRPFRVAVANRAGRLARKAGFGGGLDVDRLIDAARKKTGLSDFGDEWFLEPLAVLVKSINEEANLTTVGYAVQRSRIVSVLATRLLAERLIGGHPEIVDLELGRIILITGLQRTATTSLHRLIAADPAIRSLKTWEALNPVPLPRETRDKPEARLEAARRAEKAMTWLAPEFAAIHPLAHDAPEEDVFLLDLSFMSQSPEAMMHVPSYSEWLEQHDHTRSYEYLLTMLKVLQWQRPGRNWVLKTPNHLEHLDVALRVLPRTSVVQTHRDPKQALASFCSMVAHGRGILSDRVDAREIAAHWVPKMRRVLERSIAVRYSGSAGACIDVSYYDLLKRPIDELQRVYRCAAIEFDETSERAASEALNANVKDRHGVHAYSLDDFGLDADRIDRDFEFYTRVYRIPDEATGLANA